MSGETYEAYAVYMAFFIWGTILGMFQSVRVLNFYDHDFEWIYKEIKNLKETEV